MMPRHLLALGVAIAATAVTTSAAPDDALTFYKDVLPILQASCQDCHRPAGKNIMGMVAPMSLISYEEVRPWAKAIAKAAKSRRMPPWHASPKFHDVFSNERTLTEDEIGVLVRWAARGAPRGRSADRPKQAAFSGSGGWTIGDPDLIIALEEPYFVADYVEDEYAYLSVQVTEAQLPRDKWIKGMQFKPGSEAVHHIVLYSSDYRESVGFGRGMLGGMGPGTDATEFPEGYGRLLSKGCSLTFNMHYHKESGPGTGVWDRSEIGFTFHDKPVRHDVSWGAVGTFYFEIPAYDSNYPVTAVETFYKDTTLLALFPHMHLRGKAAKYVAYYPDGREETLLDVPNYDFNWQTNYIFKEPKKIPGGTRIEVTLSYDNSEERAKFADFDPSRSVYFGEPTTDEMMLGWIDYTATEPLKTEALEGDKGD